MSKDIQVTELHQRLDAGETIPVIDVRTEAEFATGHIPGAVNIPLDTITTTIPGYSEETPMAIVCQGGVRSMTACQRLKDSRSNLLNVLGGTNAWRQAGYEVEGAPGPKADRSLDRQTHLVAGLLLLTAFGLYWQVSPNGIYLALLPAFGLMFDALTGICPMTLILKQMPWNATP